MAKLGCQLEETIFGPKTIQEVAIFGKAINSRVGSHMKSTQGLLAMFGKMKTN